MGSALSHTATRGSHHRCSSGRSGFCVTASVVPTIAEIKAQVLLCPLTSDLLRSSLPTPHHLGQPFPLASPLEFLLRLPVMTLERPPDPWARAASLLCILMALAPLTLTLTKYNVMTSHLLPFPLDCRHHHSTGHAVGHAWPLVGPEYFMMEKMLSVLP